MKLWSRITSLVAPRSRDAVRGTLHDEGFHGDRHLLELMDWLLGRVRFFVETGTNLGTTARYVASRHPGVRVFTCEPDERAWTKAREQLAPHANAHVSRTSSPQFLYDVHDTVDELLDAPTLYWLDAHGYGYSWPLLDEVRFLTGKREHGFLAIDDFRVPGRDDFKFDEYDMQVCSFEAIRPALAKRDYTMIYPTYSERTSAHHPLTGIGLLVFGVSGFELPPRFGGSFRALPIAQTIEARGA